MAVCAKSALLRAVLALSLCLVATADINTVELPDSTTGVTKTTSISSSSYRDTTTTTQAAESSTTTTATTATTTMNNTVTTTPTPDTRKHRRRGNRRCKCIKRFTKEVNQMIDERLEDFEKRYLLHLRDGKDRSLAFQNEATRIQSMDRLLFKLNTDVVQTKEVLSTLNSNLDVLRHEMNHTRGDVRALNVSFRELDLAVDNLTRFVSRVERMIPDGVATPTSGSEPQKPVEQTYPRHCDEVYQQGGMQFQGDYYIMIKPTGAKKPFKVLCKIYNNSGWTVIQKREDGSVDFFRPWKEYRQGFGSLEGEFWLGNDHIHHLTAQEPTMLRIEMTDWEGREYYAEYGRFAIEDEKGLYRLHISRYQGDAGDSLRSHWENHDGMPFSTKDRDNDGRYYDSCAEHFHGAWWFNNCFDSHLNGKYYHKGFHKNYFQRDGIQWNTIHMYSSLRAVHMMIKPATVLPAISATSADLEKEVKVAAEDGKKRDRSRSKSRRGGSRRDRKRV